jgi:myo-inositol-1(or 4)-monophosphatase
MHAVIPDGTTNFIHGFPFACISIGVINEKKPVLGVIFNPFLDHLYYGIKDQGSFLIRNGGAEQRLPLISARPLPSISQAVIGEDILNFLSVRKLTCRRWLR